MSIEMTPREVAAFLREWPTAAFATTRKDGSPFVIPLAHSVRSEVFAAGDHVYISCGEGRTMIDRLRRDPRVCFTAFNQEMPTMAVVVEGVAHEIDDPGDAKSREIMRAGMADVEGIDLDAFEQSWLSKPRVLFRIDVTRIISWDSNKKGDLVAEASMSTTEYRRAEAAGA